MAHSGGSSTSNEPDDEAMTVAQLFEVTRQDFERETGIDLRQTIGAEGARSTDELASLIESNNAAFGQFRVHRYPTLVKHLQTFLRVTRIADVVISGPLGNIQPASMLALNAVHLLISTIDDVSLTYDTVQAMFLKVESVMKDMDVLDRDQLPPKLLPPLAELMRATIMLCALSKRLAKRGKFLTYVKGVLQGRDPAVLQQLEIIDRLRTDLSTRVGALTLGAALETRETFAEVRQNLQHQSNMNSGFQAEVRASLNEIKGTLKAEGSDQMLRAQIAKTLHPTSRHQAVFNSMRLTRAKMSGTWILEDQRYREWLDRQSNVLWISGGPGTGKTSLATYIIQELQDHAMHQGTAEQRMMVGYFFFREGDDELRTGAMRTIAAALTEQSHSFMKFVYDLCICRPELFDDDALILQEVIAPFLGMAETPHVAYIVLDGLDEAEQSKMSDCLQTLNAMMGHLQGKLQVLLVGRPEIGMLIRQDFGKLVDQISLSATTNATDIDLFIAERLPKLPHYKDLSTAVRKETREELVRKSHGLFLWAQIMLKEIEPFYRPKKIREILDAAPEAMVDLFQHILRRLSKSLKGDDATDFNSILTCCTFAQRPLSVQEVQILLKLMAEDESADAVDVQSQIVNHMSSFLVLNDADQIYVGAVAGQRTSKSLEASADDSDFSGDPYLEAYESDSDDASSAYEYNTQVLTFIHTSCLQYFRAGVNTKIGEVGIDVNEAKLRILETLLRVIVDYEEIRKTFTTRDDADQGINDNGNDDDDDTQDGDNSAEEKEMEESSDNDVAGNAADDDLASQRDTSDLEDGINKIYAYASSNWHLHLQLVDIAAVASNRRSKICGNIVKLLTVEDTTQAWMGNVGGNIVKSLVMGDKPQESLGDVADFPEIWFKNDRFRQLVCRWLQKDVTVNLTEDPKIKLLLNPHTLLQGARDILIKKWLKEIWQPWKANMLYEFLATYFATVSVDGIATDEKAEPPPKTPDAASIYATADNCNAEKTVAWHMGVAYCLFLYSLYDPAFAEIKIMREMTKAIDDIWDIDFLETQIFWAQKKWKDAIPVKRRIVKMLEETPGYLEQYNSAYWFNMADLGSLLESNKSFQDSLEIYQKIYREGPEDYRTMSLWWVVRFQRYFDLWDKQCNLFKELTRPEEDGQTRLAKVWSDLVDEGYYCIGDFFEIARKTNNLDVIEETMANALTEAVKEKDFKKQLTVQDCQAWFLDSYCDKREDAIELWRKILSSSQNRIAHRYVRDRRYWTVCAMANAYADELLNHPGDEKHAQDYLRHLEKLKANENQSPSKSTHPAAMMSAVMHLIRGNYDEYRKTMQPFLKAGLELLSDTEDANDYHGYALLTDAFMSDPDTNHLQTALWHMSWIQQRRAPTGDTVIFNDCNACHKYNTSYHGYYWCKQCLDMALCKDCWAQVEDGSLGYRLCGKNHEQFVPQECPFFDKLEVGKVCYRGELVPLAEWLKVVRQDWGIKEKVKK